MFGDVDVETVPGSLAAEVFGAEAGGQVLAPSGDRRPRAGLVPTAATDDGVTEAVELQGARFVLGVQWHPEEQGDRRPFDALVGGAACANTREGAARRAR